LCVVSPGDRGHFRTSNKIRIFANELRLFKNNEFKSLVVGKSVIAFFDSRWPVLQSFALACRLLALLMDRCISCQKIGVSINKTMTGTHALHAHALHVHALHVLCCPNVLDCET